LGNTVSGGIIYDFKDQYAPIQSYTFILRLLQPKCSTMSIAEFSVSTISKPPDSLNGC
jgi:hypothetical protein